MCGTSQQLIKESPTSDHTISPEIRVCIQSDSSQRVSNGENLKITKPSSTDRGLCTCGLQPLDGMAYRY